MSNTIIFIKLNSTATGTSDIIGRMEESYKEKVPKYYNLSLEDAVEVVDMSENDQIYFVVLLYNRAKEDQPKIVDAFLGTGIIRRNERGTSIEYEMKTKLPSNLALQNICKLTELDLTSDFEFTNYLLRVDSTLVAEQLDMIIYPTQPYDTKQRYYEKIETEKYLHPLAQRNEYCRRQYNLREPTPSRSEYQRDYERIIHSKAFRRMVDKAQVFSASKGDHYRTRMTHSQIVSQVGRAISAGLGLNLYLTEAIALGHDIGHTPFGHQGERTLDRIIRGEHNTIIKNRDLLYPDGKEGFKHNYQSIRVASVLEETYPSIPGLDLSFQTLEGMLKHTKLKREEFSLSTFTNCTDADLHFEMDFCSTLEGQVVAIADEIAQRGHDLDDALSSGTITYEELKKYLTLKKMEKLSHVIERAVKEIEEAKKNHFRQVDESSLRNSRIVSDIFSYFVQDVIDTSKQAMKGYSQERFETDGHIVTKQLVSFSDQAQVFNDYLETIISNRVITNPEVSLFDSNAATIVSGLFKAYYNNPRLLHSGAKRRLYLDMCSLSPNVVDFEFGNHNIIKEELNSITQEDFSDDPEKYEEYIEKRRILIRGICDYISGMTDTYATNEYNKIAKAL